MTLRQRLALHFGAVVAVAVLLLGGLLYHEWATEERLRALLPPERQDEARWGDTTEVVVYSLIPVVVVMGWLLTRRSLQPLTTLAQTVERIDVESLHEPLARTANGDEVDRLAGAFNTMAARLNQSFQQIRDFTLHASHELKTPLTVMRAELESALVQADGCPPPFRESLSSLSEEVDRLTKIVDALTLLTRADVGLVKLEQRPVPLAELVRESFEDAQILAEPLEVKVSLLECAEVTITGDRHRLRQLLLNLVDNAAKYNCSGGSIDISLRRAGSVAEIEIVNTGEGIPVSEQPRVFDRFVRGEEARRKGIDGSGLGLTITQWVVHAHGGTIELTSGPEKTKVLVRLPVATA
jgi:signal transduction histidine kinase